MEPQQIDPKKIKDIGLAVVSPSKGGMSHYPNRVNNGIRFLEKQGFHAVISKNAMGEIGYLSGSITERLNDLYECFINKNIQIILASIGGYNTNQLIKEINYEQIQKESKIICGYSDITALLLAIHSKTGLTVFHGPTFLPEICEYPKPLEYTWNNFLLAIQGKTILWKAPNFYVTEFCDWIEQESAMSTRKTSPCTPWKIVKTGQAEGKLLGGNLSTMLNILGTEYLPIYMFDKVILFIEEADCSPARFDSLLYALEIQGILEKIAGLVIGRFVNCDIGGQNEIFRELLLEITKKYNFPILVDVDLGHTDPMITIPVGRKGYLKCVSEKEIEFGVMSAK